MFKPSHLTTPRNLADCTFTVGYDVIQRAERMHRADRIVLWGCTLAAIALVLIMLFVPEAK